MDIFQVPQVPTGNDFNGLPLTLNLYSAKWYFDMFIKRFQLDLYR